LSPHPLGRRIGQDGEIRTAAGAGRIGWIDTRDIAATAAALLSDPGAVPGDWRDYLLTGPQSLSYPEAVAIITAVTGLPVRVVQVSAEEQTAQLQAVGIPADAGVRAGHEDEISTAVHDLTGRPPHAFAQFVEEHAARWAAPAV
jgi:uncharacterized protein YbjT (DUF2867 family)